MLWLFLTDDIIEKVVLQSRSNKYKPIRRRIQMRATNDFYPIKASNFGEDGGIIKSELLGSRKKREKISGSF